MPRGASWFASQGAAVIAHRICAAAMRAEHPGLVEERRRRPGLAGLFDDAIAGAPSATFDEDLSLDLGDLLAQVSHPGHGHTAGDAVVFFPSESVAVCGDLVSNGYHVNVEDALRAGLRTGVDGLRALGADRYVPGHGAPGGRELLDRQDRYHETMRELVRDGIDARRSDEEIAADVRRRFPGYRLEVVVPTAVARWRSWLAG